MNPPPWIQSITGSGSRPLRIGAITFRYRQSSDAVHAALFCTAAYVVLQAAAGCGGCQRSDPTGGAAYGIPSHCVVLPVTTPQTHPRSVLTSVPAAHVAAAASLEVAARIAPAAATTDGRRTSRRLFMPKSKSIILSSPRDAVVPVHVNFLRRDCSPMRPRLLKAAWAYA